MKQPRKNKNERSVYVTLALLVSAGPLAACAAMNDALEAGKSMINQPAGSGSGAPGAPGAPGGEDAKPSGGGDAKPSGGGDSKTWCCVGPDDKSMSFYDCKTAENAIKCMGNPFEISPCAQKCPPGDANCPKKCMEDHGPNPKRGNCMPDAKRNAECAKK